MKNIYLKLLITFYIIFATISILKAQFGVQTNLNIKPTPNYLRDVKMADVNNVWAVGDFGTIIHTTDGGNTWNIQTSGTTNRLNSLAVISSTEAIAIGNNGTILRTTDGINWSSISLGATTNLQDIYAFSSSAWIIVGDGGKIYKTTNTGTSFNTITSPTSSHLLGIHFPDATNGYIVGVSGVALKSTNAGDNWVSLTTSQTYNLNDVFFTDANTGFAVGGSSNNRVLKTTDGGNIWSETILPYSSDAAYDVFFENANNGYVVGGLDRFYRTTDAGTTWTFGCCSAYPSANYGVHFIGTTGFIVGEGGIQKSTNSGVSYTPFDATTTNRRISKMQFVDVNTAYATGYDMNLKTTDGGITWAKITSLANNLYNALHFIDINNGWVVGYNTGDTGIRRTTDGGASWTNQTPPVSTSYYDIQMIDANTGWIVGDGGNIFNTINGGTNWNSQTSGTINRLNAVNFVDANNGWAVGQNATVLKTTNGGATWAAPTGALPSVGTTFLYDVLFIDANTGWISGNNGTIWRTTDGGTSWSSVTTGSGFAGIIQRNSDGILYVQGGISSNFAFASYDQGITWTPIPTLNISNQVFSLIYHNNALYFGGNQSFVAKQTINYTKWNGTSWSNGAPTSTVDAWLDADYTTTTGNISCRRLALSAGKKLIVAAGTSVTASSGFSNQGTAYNACGGSLSISGGTFGSGTTIFNQSEINLQGNSVTIVNGDSSPDTNDHTKFNSTSLGSSSTRTFTIQNSGLGSLAISNVLISGTNADQFSITTSPNSSVAASGSTTFEITFLPTSIGTKTATINISNSDCDEYSYTFDIEGIATPPNNALDFGGSNDYLRINSTNALISGNNDHTVEFWVNYKGGQTGDRWINWFGTPAVSYQCQIIGFDGSTRKVKINHYAIGDDLTASTATIGLNTWTHVAVVYKGASKTNDIYIDGEYIETLTYTTNLSLPTNMILELGTFNSNFIFNANIIIDEYRFWNIARTCDEIRANMNNELLGNESNLGIYYNFNQGINAGNNTSITSLEDLTSNNNDLFFNNFSLSGANSNFINSTTGVSGTTPTLLPEISVSGNITNITDGDASPSTSDNTDFGNVTIGNNLQKDFIVFNDGLNNLTITNVTLTGTNASEFSIATLPTFPFDINPSNQQIVSVIFTPTSGEIKTATLSIYNNDCDEPVFNFELQGFGDYISGNALSLDGTGYVNLGNARTLEVFDNITIEGWIKPTGGSSIQTIISNKIGGLSNNGFAFFYNSWSTTDRTLHFETFGSDAVTSGAVITLNTWQHVAVSVQGTTVTMYVNGVAQTLAGGASANVSPSGLNTYIGVFADLQYKFTGEIDELRIWNKALSSAEINASMNKSLSGLDCNLVSYWNFNEASSDVIDITGTGNNGTLNGGVTRVSSTAPIISTVAAPTSCTTTWDGTSWSNGAPTVNTTAILDTDYNVSTHNNFYCKNLEVNFPYTLTFASTANSVIVRGDLYNYGTVNNCANGSLNITGSIIGNAVNVNPASPSTEASSITIDEKTSHSIAISWTNGNGAKRIVVIKPSSAVSTTALTDNVTYTADNNFMGSGTVVDGTGKVVYNGTGSSLTISNLSANTTYHVAIFEYNEDVLCGQNYLTGGTPANISFQTFSTTTWNGTSWSNGTPDDTKDAIIDGLYNTSLNGDFTAANLTVNTSSILYIHDGGAININGTNAGKVITDGEIRICSSGTFNYNINGGGMGVITPAFNDEPTVSSSGIAVLSVTSTKLSVQWVVGNGQKRILTVKDGGFTNQNAVLNGQDYVSNAQFGVLSSQIDGSSVVFDDFDNNVSIFGLNPNTTYYLSIFEYNTNCGSPTYLTSSVGTHIVTTLQNTIWNGASWSNGVPDNTKEAVIDGIYDTNLHGSITAKYLTVNSGASVFIQNGGSVAIDFDVENNGTIYQCAAGVYTVGGTSIGTGVHHATYPFAPSIAASSPTISKLTAGTVELNWVVGNGEKRIVIFKANAPIDLNAITDGSLYAADNNMLGTGDLIDGGLVVYNGNSNTVTVINLVANTTYYYAIVEYNEACGTNNYATTSSLTGNFTMSDIPFAPTNLNANPVNHNTIYLSWDDTNNFETNYYVEKSDFNNLSFVQIATLSPNTTSYTVSGLESNETYYFRVRAAEYINYSNYSNEANATTLITSPTLQEVTTITNSSFLVNWNNISEANGYEIDVSTEANFSSFVSGYESLALDASTTSLIVNGLTGNAFYYVRVRATIGSNKSPNSNTVSALTVPDAMTILNATNITKNGFRANWNYQPNSIGFELEVATDETFTQILVDYAPFVTVLSYKDVSGLNAGTTYYYSVRMRNESGTSANSNIISLTTLPDAPVNNEVSGITDSSFTASWSFVNGATSYLLEVASDNNFNALVSGYNPLELSTNSQIVSNLDAGTTYYVRVKAKNASGESENSNIITALTVANAPVIADTDNSDITQTSFVVSWQSVESANAYQLFVATDILFANTLSGYDGYETTATSKKVEGLEAGKWYYFKVKTINASGESAFSAIDSVLTNPATPEIIEASNLSNASFDLAWTESQGAELGYWLDVATNESFTTYVDGFQRKETINLIENISSLEAGTMYYARVRARNESGTSPTSKTFAVLTLPASPETKQATLVAANSFTANWTSVKSATTYLFELATDESFTHLVTGYEMFEINSTSLALQGLESGTSYYYRVRANNESGSSDYSNVTQVTTLAEKPVLENISNITTNSFELKWLSVLGANSYLIDVALDDAFSNLLPNYQHLETTDLTLTVQGLEAGTTYHTRVRAKGETGLSDYSNVLNVLTLPSVPVFLGRTHQVDRVLITWEAVQSAYAYLLDVALDETFTNILESYNNVEITNNSTTITGLTAYTNYFVRVRAKNTTGLSDYSATQNVKTKPQTVVLSEATNVSDTSFSFSWMASEVASSYDVQVSTNAQFSSTVVATNLQTTNYTADNLNANTTYYFRVRVMTTDDASEYSSALNTTTAPLAPNLTFQNSTENSLTIRWGDVNSAQGYAIDIATDESFTNILPDYQNKSLTGSSFTATNLSPATTYYLHMRSVGSKGVSGNSATLKAMTAPLAPHLQEPINFTNNSFKISWTSDSPANFGIEVATNERFTDKLQNWNGKVVSGNETIVDELSAGTTYFVRIKSLGVENVVLPSSYSNVVIGITIPTAPTAMKASNQNSDSFTANWQSVQGATQYELTVATDANMSNIISNFPIQTDKLSHQVNNLTALTTYFYTVKALNNSGISERSNVISTKTASIAPIASNASNISSNAFQANWQSVDGITSYRLEVSQSESFDVLVFHTETSNTNFPLDGLIEGTKYFYRVKAKLIEDNQTLISSPSNIVEVYLPKTPEKITFSKVSSVGFTINWGADINANSFQIDVSEKEDFSTFVEGYQAKNIIGNSFKVEDLLGNVTYYVRLRSITNGAISNNTTTYNQTTLPPLPDVARIKRIPEKRITKIEWFYSAAFKQSLADITFSLERSDNEGEPFRKITEKDLTYNPKGIVYEDFTAQNRLRATYKLIVKNKVGESSLEFAQRIITANEEEWAEENWILYPIPANEIVYLKMPDAVEKASLKILDIQGKELMGTEIISNDGKPIKLYIESLPKGTYVLEILHKNFIINKKFVK
ncbi:MAG: hypothetical protein OHK0038_08900 [Flammeovirgaceae bacterium]